mmetsp:Transcript_12911/g.39038  ORF Transcript_12911/g.39038 Transcript_12911/m.39038 type:complete len:236 (-) Transcript_12911:1239-1946(-)
MASTTICGGCAAPPAPAGAASSASASASESESKSWLPLRLLRGICRPRPLPRLLPRPPRAPRPRAPPPLPRPASRLRGVPVAVSVGVGGGPHPPSESVSSSVADDTCAASASSAAAIHSCRVGSLAAASTAMPSFLPSPKVFRAFTGSQANSASSSPLPTSLSLSSPWPDAFRARMQAAMAPVVESMPSSTSPGMPRRVKNTTGMWCLTYCGAPGGGPTSRGTARRRTTRAGHQS